MEDSVEKVIIEVVFDPVEAKTEVIKDHDKISQIVKGLQRPAYEVINAAPVPEAT